jgi:hypothetical protein
MRNRIGQILVLAALAILALPMASVQAEDPTFDYKSTEFEDILRNPAAYKGSAVSFRAIYHQTEDTWTPFFTPYLPDDFIAFSAWAPSTALWTRNGHLADLPTLMLDKRGKWARALGKLPKYATVEIYGVVESTFNDLPWIRVTAVKKIKTVHYDPTKLHHLVAGTHAYANGKPLAAIDHLKKAIELDLPDLGALAAWEALGDAYLSLQNYREAENAYSQARSYRPEDALLGKKYDYARAAASAVANGNEAPALPDWFSASEGGDDAEDNTSDETSDNTGNEQPSEATNAMVAELTAQLEMAKAELTDTRTALQNAEAARDNAVMLAEQGNAGLNKVMQELDTLRNEVTTQGQALKKESELRAALEKAAKDAGSSNDELKSTYEKQLMDLQATVDQLRQQNTDLQKALDEAKQNQGGGEGNDEQVKALEAANAALTADLATARVAAQEAADALAAAKTACGEHETMLKTADDNLKAKDAEIAALNQKLAAGAEPNEALTALQNENAELKASRDGLETRVNELTLESEGQKSTISDLEAQLANAAGGDDSAAQIAALQADLDAANAAKAAAEADSASNAAEIEQLKKQVNNLKEELKRAMGE